MQDCIFCKIIENEIPAKVIMQNEDVLVIEDIAPKAPIHYLIIPKKHIKNVSSLTDVDFNIMAKIGQIAQKIAQQLDGSKSFRLIFNNGPDAGQTVWHLHAHFISGKHLSDF